MSASHFDAIAIARANSCLINLVTVPIPFHRLKDLTNSS